MTIEIIIEAVVAILLIATCTYWYVLSRRLSALRKGQKELLDVISKFDAASRRAEQNLAAMQNNGVSMGRDLDAVTARANALIDELSVMVNAGDHIAGRIEGVVNEVRTLGARRSATIRKVAS